MLKYITKIFNPDTVQNIAKQHGTPCYVYDKQKIIDNYNNYKQGFAQNNCDNFLICYAVKANSNLAILKILAEEGAGFDIVSLGELTRVLKAGGDANKIVFSGVGKQDFEIKAALEVGINSFNVESEPELLLINQIAQNLNKKAPVSIRVNPNIDAKSHPYISTGLKEHKFGIAIESAENIYNTASELKNIHVAGIDCHIGSQITELSSIKDTCTALNKLLSNLQKNNLHIEHVNFGGGLGIDYTHSSDTKLPCPQDWINTILNNINFSKKIIIEPGRSIIGNAGILLTKVIYNKTDITHQHNFTIVDAAMNDLLRPALYSAKHKIVNISNNNSKEYITSIVGPVCESSDVFAKNINLYSHTGDILAILDTGAYGFTMSSNYNTRPRPAEVLIDSNNQIKLIRRKETIEDLYQHET